MCCCFVGVCSCNNDDDGITQAMRKVNVVENGVLLHEVDEYKEPLTEDEVIVGCQIKNCSLRLMQELYSMTEGTENIVFSPYSMNELLSIAGNGADGESREKILAFLNMGKDDMETLNSFNKKTSLGLDGIDSGVTFKASNAVWIQHDIPVYSKFIDICKKIYETEVNGISFQSSKAGQAINRWCSENTEGCIKNVVNDGSLYYKMLLTNAIYFKGNWSHRFQKDKTTEEIFTSNDGSTNSVPMMHKSSSYSYTDTNDGEWLSIGFGNGTYRMTFGLPHEDVRLVDFLSSLNADKWNEILISMKEKEVDFWLPRLNLNGNLYMKNLLQKHGISCIFQPQKALFSNLSPEEVWINEISQKTYLRLDEEGCEAAALTSTGLLLANITDNTKLIKFHLDRPFIFAIHENARGNILFLGCINNL